MTKRNDGGLVLALGLLLLASPAPAAVKSVVEVFNRGDRPITVLIDGKKACTAAPGVFCDGKARRGKHKVQVVVGKSEKYADWVIIPAPSGEEAVGACMFKGDKLECAHEDIGK